MLPSPLPTGLWAKDVVPHKPGTTTEASLPQVGVLPEPFGISTCAGDGQARSLSVVLNVALPAKSLATWGAPWDRLSEHEWGFVDYKVAEQTIIKMMEFSRKLFLFLLFNQVMPQIRRNPVVSTTGQKLSSHLSTGCAGQQPTLSVCFYKLLGHSQRTIPFRERNSGNIFPHHYSKYKSRPGMTLHDLRP